MLLIETRFFMQRVDELLSPDEFQALENVLVYQPDIGKLIPQGSGLRKMRWVGKGKGKRGGSRIIYYWAVSQDQILLLYIYSKNEQQDLTKDQIKMLSRIVREEYP